MKLTIVHQILTLSQDFSCLRQCQTGMRPSSVLEFWIIHKEPSLQCKYHDLEKCLRRYWIDTNIPTFQLSCSDICTEHLKWNFHRKYQRSCKTDMTVISLRSLIKTVNNSWSVWNNREAVFSTWVAWWSPEPSSRRELEMAPWGIVEGSLSASLLVIVPLARVDSA